MSQDAQSEAACTSGAPYDIVHCSLSNSNHLPNVLHHAQVYHVEPDSSLDTTLLLRLDCISNALTSKTQSLDFVYTMEDKQEPIAIVGMSCRFPGKAENPQGFFEMLARGESAWSELPKTRFEIEAYYHPSIDRDGAVRHLFNLKTSFKSDCQRLRPNLGSF